MINLALDMPPDWRTAANTSIIKDTYFTNVCSDVKKPISLHGKSASVNIVGVHFKNVTVMGNARHQPDRRGRDLEHQLLRLGHHVRELSCSLRRPRRQPARPEAIASLASIAFALASPSPRGAVSARPRGAKQADGPGGASRCVRSAR